MHTISTRGRGNMLRHDLGRTLPLKSFVLYTSTRAKSREARQGRHFSAPSSSSGLSCYHAILLSFPPVLIIVCSPALLLSCFDALRLSCSDALSLRCPALVTAVPSRPFLLPLPYRHFSGRLALFMPLEGCPEKGSHCCRRVTRFPGYARPVTSFSHAPTLSSL